MFWKKRDDKSNKDKEKIEMELNISSDDIELGFDPNLYNEEAVEVAMEYEITEWQGDINDAIEERLRTELVNFIKTSGYTIGDVIKGLIDAGLDEEKAYLIAQTEITRVYALAEQRESEKLKEDWDDFNDVREVKTWFTCNDDLVCEICKPLHGRNVLVKDEFSDGIDKPPAHTGCRCWMSIMTDILEDMELYQDK